MKCVSDDIHRVVKKLESKAKSSVDIKWEYWAFLQNICTNLLLHNLVCRLALHIESIKLIQFTWTETILNVHLINFRKLKWKQFLQNVYQTKTFTKIVATREELKSGKENKRFQQMQQDMVLDRHKPPGRKTDYCFQVVGLLTFHFIQKHHYPTSNLFWDNFRIFLKISKQILLKMEY